MQQQIYKIHLKQHKAKQKKTKSIQKKKHKNHELTTTTTGKNAKCTFVGVLSSLLRLRLTPRMHPLCSACSCMEHSTLIKNVFSHKKKPLLAACHLINTHSYTTNTRTHNSLMHAISDILLSYTHTHTPTHRIILCGGG